MSHVGFNFVFLCSWRVGTKQHPICGGVTEDPPSRARGSCTFWDPAVLVQRSPAASVRGYHIHWLAENIMIKPMRQFLFDHSRGILPLSAAQDLVLWQGLYHRPAWSQHWGHISIFSFLVLSTVSVSRGQRCSELWHRFQSRTPLLLDSRARAGVALGIFPRDVVKSSPWGVPRVMGMKVPAWGPKLTNLFWGKERLQGRISAAPPRPGEETVPTSFPKPYRRMVKTRREHDLSRSPHKTSWRDRNRVLQQKTCLCEHPWARNLTPEPDNKYNIKYLCLIASRGDLCVSSPSRPLNSAFLLFSPVLPMNFKCFWIG